MNSALIFAIAQILRRGKCSFLKKTLNPSQYQERFLFKLLREHQDTEFGRDHQLAEIQTVDDYRRHVPIHTYQDFDPLIQRMAAGESHILIKDAPIYFNITSGSTGKRKLIPVTKASRKCIKKAFAVASAFLADATLRENRPLGSLLFPASINAVGKTASGVEFASVSSSDLKLSNVISRSVMATPIEAHCVSNLKSRYYLCALFALANPNLRMIAETFPVTALRLCKFLEDYSESLIADLKSKTLVDWLKIDDDQRSRLQAKIKCSASRIQELEEILAREGRLVPKTAWPNLSFMVTARGGTSDFYFSKFPEYFGDLPVFGGVYSSAEATFGIHRDFGTDGVLLSLESGFYEFIPEADWDIEQPQTVLPHELEVRKRYRILVTNYNGFYRYDVGDVVEIEGFQNQTPIFIFRRRYRGFITSVGEKRRNIMSPKS
ncbi:MAG: GH3 auxin-responsive promoter family protein [Acaryochloridaceae cyanobacterium RL_2_7]|nr:GH3 auxin-responsive promoter family protein [Acaryochloridaceae cyanobacterium RL_2_7]